MIELSIESFPMDKRKQLRALRLREDAILEFSDGEIGYLIERFGPDSFSFTVLDGESSEPGPVTVSLYQALEYAAMDWEDTHDSFPSIQWVEDLKAANRELRRVVDEFEIELIQNRLMAQFPPKRPAIDLEQAEPDQQLEAIARQGAIIDRLNCNQGLIYLVQRTKLNLFRFAVLDPGKEPRYGGSQTTELRQVYELIRQDAEANYEYQHWSLMNGDLEAFLGRPEVEAESYLVLKKLYRSFSELDHDGRKFSEVLAVAEEISSIFGK